MSSDILLITALVLLLSVIFVLVLFLAASNASIGKAGRVVCALHQRDQAFRRVDLVSTNRVRHPRDRAGNHLAGPPEGVAAPRLGER